MSEIDDEALARQLQEQFDREQLQANLSSNPNENGLDYATLLAIELGQGGNVDTSAAQNVCSASGGDSTDYTDQLLATSGISRPLSIVDSEWEMIDPCPDARMLFLEFNKKYFWGKLDGVEVRWSPRMTLCAGLCCYEGRGGYCSIRLSTPLLKLRPRKDLVETLLHEMIHALLFVTQNNKDHDGHGPEFHKHMYRINKDAGTNISVYHNFHDEVENYRQHWWKCDGICVKKPPYYGIVKRSMNRAPSKNDTWWADHQSSCGGTYTKIKEPEGYKSKKDKSKETTTKAKPPGAVDIRSVFGGKGNTTNKPPSSGSASTVSKPGTSSSKNTDKPKQPLPKYPTLSDLGSRGGASTSTKNEKSNKPPQKYPTISNVGVRGGSSTSTIVVKPKQNTKTDLPKGVSVDDADKHTQTTADFCKQKQPEAFGGAGKTLSGSSSDSQAARSNVIVRKIPGFGVIRTERPADSENNERSGSCDKSLKRDCDEMGTSSSKVQTNAQRVSDMDDIFDNDATFLDLMGNDNPASTSSANASKSNVSTKTDTARKSDVVKRGFDDDSDSDLELPMPPKKKAKRKSLDDFLYGGGKKHGTPPGTAHKIPGFRSVSNKARLSDPKSKHKTIERVKDRREVMSGDMSVSRNRRAMDLGSDVDTDNEDLTLGSVIKKGGSSNRASGSGASGSAFNQTNALPGSSHGSANIISRPSGTVGSSNSSRYRDPIPGSSSFSNNRLTIPDSPPSQRVSTFIDTTPAVAAEEEKVRCPVCSAMVSVATINDHLDGCLT